MADLTLVFLGALPDPAALSAGGQQRGLQPWPGIYKTLCGLCDMSLVTLVDSKLALSPKIQSFLNSEHQ